MNSSISKVLLALSCFLYLASAQNETNITEPIQKDDVSWLYKIIYANTTIIAMEVDSARNTAQEYIDTARNALATTEVLMNTVVDSFLRALNLYELYMNPSLRSATDAAITGLDIFESITSPIPIVGNVVSGTVGLGKSVANKANNVGQAFAGASESFSNALYGLTGGLLETGQNNDSQNATDKATADDTTLTGSLYNKFFG